jgi:uncharacterized protein involved in exopolysaccharide biosynthesis
MDQLTRFASKLYPRWWRTRYGEEFAALLEETRPGFGGTMDVMKGALTMQLSTFSAKRVLVAGAIVGLGIGFATTFLLAPQYSSSAVISVWSADNGALTEAVEQLSQDVMSRGNLASMSRNLNLYPGERQRMPIEDVLEMMKENIRIVAAPVIVNGKNAPAFQLSFMYPDQIKAQKVVNALISGFIDANILSRNSAKPKNVTLEIMDAASLPATPISPDRGIIALAGMGAGLLLSAALAVILHFRRKRQPA